LGDSLALANPTVEAPASAPASATSLPGEPVANLGATSLSSKPADPPQTVYGVHENYSWQAYLGYTYLRFYEVPGTTQNKNGFNYSMVYFINKWIGADGEFVATFGSQSGTSSHLLLGMGGGRVRWAAPRGLELWAHGLAGESHFTPQTPYGGQSAMGFEAGAGVDINAHHRRLAYRVSGDMVGTRYFNTYQYSPKISVGVVFKF
jgi:hypothetical protein